MYLISLGFLVGIAEVPRRPVDHCTAGTETADPLLRPVGIHDLPVLYYYPVPVVLVCLYLYRDHHYLSGLVVSLLHVDILFLSAQEFRFFCKFCQTGLLLFISPVHWHSNPVSG